MKQYNVDNSSQSIKICDKKGQPLVLQKVTVAGSTDNWLRVHSEAKALKESGMNSRFSQRFEEGLLKIKENIARKKGVKKQEKIWERIGRLKVKNASIHKYYEIVSEIDKTGVVTTLSWKQKLIEKNEGYYLLRTTLDQKDEKTQWTIYNTIREIEGTFSTLKTDLDLRPVYHKTDKASMAHLHLGLLAYWAVNTIRHQLKQKQINNEWRDIVRIMNTQKIVTTAMDNDCDQQIIIRQCSEPNEQVNKIYSALNFKPKPFTRKKSVVPLKELKKTKSITTPQLFSD